jgi:chemotaxis protein MotB
MPKRGPEPVKENNERWLLTYADLITLLLAFFVIMYALANVDVKKFENLKGSLSKAFNTGVLTGAASSSVVPSGQITEPTTEQVNRTSSAILNAIANLPQGTGFPDVIQFITQRQDGIAVSISGTLSFVSGSAELTPEGVAVVRQLAEVFKSLPNDIRVEAHTDDLTPGSVRYPTNWELSAARAVTIAKEFVKDGIPASRLVAAGFADQRPLLPNTTPQGRNTNRRAEVILLNPLPAPAGGPALGPTLTITNEGAL